jgi:hypothetical protein
MRDILTVGVNRLVQTLNKENLPTMTGKGAWEQAGLATMVRSRMLLGEQRVSQYVDGVRTFTGEVIKVACPAVVTEDQWTLASAALDGRKKGVMNGRNATKMANLFGDMARCEVCGGRMKIKQKGRSGQFKYFGCSAAGVGRYEAKNYHRLDQVETRLLHFFKAAPEYLSGKWQPEPVADKSVTPRAEIGKTKAEAATIFGNTNKRARDRDRWPNRCKPNWKPITRPKCTKSNCWNANWRWC